MSEDPRRSKVRPEPGTPSGYRSSRRASKSLKSAKRAQRQHRMFTFFGRVNRGFRDMVILAAYALAFGVLVMLVLWGAASAINGIARWRIQRAEDAKNVASQRQKTDENLVVIGVDDGGAVGYLALRVDAKGKQIFGIAIPEGAFIEVPGRGFERIGEAYASGPDTALTAISNYFTVQFESYVIVPSDVYKACLTEQTLSGVVEAVDDGNLSKKELGALEGIIEDIPQRNVALVPMPVKPVKLGEQTYFEPQREEIADLLKSWWGVDASLEQAATRVIVYNGAGVPGIAGDAAHQLIRDGFRVVDTKNADRFDYAKTRIVVTRGDDSRGASVKKSLGVGEVIVATSTADVTDVIVIIGKDYRPE